MTPRLELPLCDVRLSGRRVELALRFEVEHGEATREIADKLLDWFTGYLRQDRFDLPAGGNLSQRRIWAEVQQIPFGETRTYGEIGKLVSAPAQTIRAAFRLLDSDLVVPWHRVIRRDGWMDEPGRSRTQALLLFLEGHAVKRHGSFYRLVRR